METSPTLNLRDFADMPLQTDEGKPINLADYVGKRVLIFAFPRADTPGCTTQACGFRDAFPKVEAAGALVFGISTDEPKALAKWKVKQNLPYTLISDPHHMLIGRLGAWGERSMYGRKFEGTIRSHFVFDATGALEKSEVKVSPEASVRNGVSELLRAIET
jgi:peroxiredoxin Q/BCP